MVIARKVVLQCGPHSINLESLLSAFPSYQHRFLQEPDKPTTTTTTINTINSFLWMRQAVRDRVPLSLAKVCHFLADKQVSEPRDRIYSLLGMLEHSDLRSEGESKPLSIGYDRPLPQVFTEATRWSVERDQDLRVLSLTQILDSDDARPSWVPDFTKAPFRVHLLCRVAS